jgi:folate-dependent phosphoribosylglycinamide formyltransferase PurN
MQPEPLQSDPVPTRKYVADGIVLLTSGGPMAACVANALAEHFGSIIVLEEEREPKWHIIRRRARRLGWVTALGQLGCAALLGLAARRTQARIEAIAAAHGLITRLSPSIERRRIGSVNSKACRDVLRALQPRVVAVYGTRIIRRETLKAVSAPFINCHAGINPKYRGQHPGYWALVNGDAQNVGVTIHLVDEGVDTGAVLYQSRVAFAPEDNILTYQWVQIAHALPLLARAVEDALSNGLRPQHVRLPSRQWFPPTLWAYAWNGLTRGVW